jgi:succinylarginine dihydrolase
LRQGRPNNIDPASFKHCNQHAKANFFLTGSRIETIPERNVNWLEVNFDGLIGPTHNYAGLAFGNLASATYQDSVATPRVAALQGLEKMRQVWQLGVKQAVLPPQLRPCLELLRAHGFQGAPAELIEQAFKAQPKLLAASYSASNMWTANAATISPSIDCADDRLHFTPANLFSTMHRAIEASKTASVLRFLFSNSQHFVVHEPLPGYAVFADEGAANHIRLSAGDDPGLEIFVYGRDAIEVGQPGPQRFPARQSKQACQAIARHHQLAPERTLFVQQNPAAIDAGAFHNDVVSVGHENVLLYHELAFLDGPATIERIRESFHSISGHELVVIPVSLTQLSLDTAVATYLFNSQLLSIGDGKLLLLCPLESVQNSSAKAVLESIVAGENPISDYAAVDLRQSMMNGGGPACLRLRVLMNQQQINAMHPGVMFDLELYERLRDWIERHYREKLAFEDLRDPQLVSEVATAQRELAKVLAISEQVLGL